jgi:hypothetical protein
MEEEGSYGKSLRPEDIVADEDAQYESEEENIEAKFKEKPVGPPLDLEIPLRPPPARPEKVYNLFYVTLCCCDFFIIYLFYLIYMVLAHLI